MSEIEFLVGCVVEEVRVSKEFRVVLDAGESVEPALYVDVGDFAYIDPSGKEHPLDAGDDPSGLGPALGMVGKRIDAVSTEDGILGLTFADGSRVQCEPDEKYEAWQVVGGSPKLVICGGGGELVIVD